MKKVNYLFATICIIALGFVSCDKEKGINGQDKDNDNNTAVVETGTIVVYNRLNNVTYGEIKRVQIHGENGFAKTYTKKIASHSSERFTDIPVGVYYVSISTTKSYSTTKSGIKVEKEKTTTVYFE